MCCCGKPSINGQPNAYSWDGKSFMTNTPRPPDLGEGDELIFDLPGRCGGMDSHSYHLRLVKARFGGYALLVRHGGGDERLPFGRDKLMVTPLEALEEGARYWFLIRFYHVHTDAIREAKATEGALWRKAAAEKRIKTQKQRGRNAVKVWIEPAPASTEAAA